MGETHQWWPRSSAGVLLDLENPATRCAISLAVAKVKLSYLICLPIARPVVVVVPLRLNGYFIIATPRHTDPQHSRGGMDTTMHVNDMRLIHSKFGIATHTDVHGIEYRSFREYRGFP